MAPRRGALRGWPASPPQDRANLGYYTFNDLASVRAAAAEAGGDLAGHRGQPVQARRRATTRSWSTPRSPAACASCATQTGAALILDDVRCGFRLHLGSSWEPIGVMPDLSAWSKAIANGYPLAAVLGSGAFRDAAASIFVTGSFWFSAAADGGGDRHDRRTARRRRDRGDGPDRDRAARRDPAAGARSRDIAISYTGPAAMPYLTFAGDQRSRAGGHIRGGRCAAAPTCIRGTTGSSPPP